MIAGICQVEDAVSPGLWEGLELLPAEQEAVEG